VVSHFKPDQFPTFKCPAPTTLAFSIGFRRRQADRWQSSGYLYGVDCSKIWRDFGGQQPDRIKNVAARVAKYRAQGDKVVVVVSAMSGVHRRPDQAGQGHRPLPSEREMDMLLATGEQQTIALTAIALHSLNVPAVSLTGAQAGIVTDGVHTKAKIHNITPNGCMSC